VEGLYSSIDSSVSSQVGLSTRVIAWGSSIKGQLGDRGALDDMPAVTPQYVVTNHLLDEVKASPIVYAGTLFVLFSLQFSLLDRDLLLQNRLLICMLYTPHIY
jgi:hypothetical protein